VATYSAPRALQASKIDEIGSRFGSYCGSLFLDLRFRTLVQELLAAHPSHLDEASLDYFARAFSSSAKLNYRGPEDDAKMFHFGCLQYRDARE
jgi:hypothetical protein